MENSLITIRPALNSDLDAIWQIIQAVIQGGDTYVFEPKSSRDKMLSYWLAADKSVFVAVVDNKIAGTFTLKANQIDLGDHIANASYMVSPAFRGRNIGYVMGQQSIRLAKSMGYKAIQFNYVIKSNEAAVNLWLKLGFSIVGEIPNAFRHLQAGYTNVYVMYRSLEEE